MNINQFPLDTRSKKTVMPASAGIEGFLFLQPAAHFITLVENPTTITQSSFRDLPSPKNP
jgi:hypothetical protein